MRQRIIATSTLVLGVLLFLPAGPVESATRSQGGLTFIETSSPKKPKKIADMYSATRVPNDIDTSGPLELMCDITSFLSGPDGLAGRNVKASWRMMAHRVDHIAGTFESFDVASGIARTGDTGIIFIDVAVPPTVANAIFADGFESGDVSVLLVGHAQLTNGAKINSPTFGCNVIERDR